MSEHSDHTSRIAELRAMRLSDMTLGDASDKIMELIALEQKQRSSRTPSYKVVKNVTGKRIPSYEVSDKQHEQKEQVKPRVSELIVGRYIMTVLAAVLCLLAFGVLLATIWDKMPNIGKFVAFMMLGIGLESLGTILASRGHIQPFWLGIAGVGAGISFIDLLSGCLFWQLYGLILTCVFVLIWFGANMCIGHLQDIGLYYIIAYAGGLIAVLLTCEVVPGGLYGEIAILLITSVITIAGCMEYFSERKQYLISFNIIFCALVCSRLVYMLINDEKMAYHILPWFCIVMSCWCLYAIHYVSVSTERKTAILFKAGITFIFSALAYNSIEIAFSEFEMHVVLTSLCLIICLGVIGIGATQGYILGISFALSDCIISISKEYSCSTLLLAIALVALVWFTHIEWSWDNRAAFGVCYLYTSIEGTPITENSFLEISVAFLTFMTLVISVVGYSYRSVKSDKWFNKPFDILTLTMLPGISTYILTDIDVVPESLSHAVMLLGLYSYYFLYVIHSENDSIQNAKVVWYLLRGITYFALLLDMIFPETSDKVVLTITMMAAMGFNVYQLIHTKSSIQAVLTCFLVNFEMLYIINLWGLEINIFISLLGMLIATGFVSIGFALNIKSARKLGLGCAVLYSVKLGLFDVAGHSGLGVAGGLLVAGLLCFGISLAYNKLGKKYEMKTSEEKNS